MKRTVKERLRSDGALSLYSILLLALGFAAVCTAVLLLLSRTDLFDWPHSSPAETTGDVIPDFGEIDYRYTPVPTVEESADMLLRAYPFTDRFYMEHYMLFVLDSDATQDYCRIWRDGTRYRIVFNEGSAGREHAIISDGKHVAFLNDRDELLGLYTYSEAYAFEKMAYIPSFLLLSDGVPYTVTKAEQANGELTVIYEIPSLSFKEDIRISEGTGLIRNIRSYFAGKLISRYDIGNYELDYTFSGEEFDLSAFVPADS